MLKNTLTIALLLNLTCACALEKASFYSEPPGASIFINGEEIGRTPCEYRYTANSGKSYEVSVNADGYVPVNEKIIAEETDIKSKAKWIVAGIIWSPLWIGTFFTKKLKEAYHFFLKKETLPEQVAQNKISSQERPSEHIP